MKTSQTALKAKLSQLVLVGLLGIGVTPLMPQNSALGASLQGEASSKTVSFIRSSREPYRSSELVRGDLGAKVDKYLREFEGVDFSGVVLVAKDGQVVLQRGYGYSDRSHHVRVTSATVFDILSVTKQFTAAAILKLQMQGKLSVIDALGKFFDNVPEDKRGITIHQLLTHTAGLPRYSGGDYEVMERNDLIKWAWASKLQSSPGKRYSYSNVGYSLLAAIIENASGQKYEDYLSQSLFKPAGMFETGYRLPKWAASWIAHGYRGDQDWGRPTDKLWGADGPYWNLIGNGGILSTATDMYRWHLALERDSVLSADARRQLFTPYVSEDPDDPEWQGRYAYGWAVRPTKRGTRLITHTGRNPAFYSDFMRFVDENVVIFFATNNTDFQSLAAQIPGIIFGDERLVEPPVTKGVPASRLRQLAGSYRLPSGAEILVSASERGLKLAGTDQESLIMSTSGRHVDAQILKNLNDRISHLIDAASAGNFRALRDDPDGRVLEELEADWNDWIKQYGRFQGFRVLGTFPRGKIDHTTLVRVNFEKRALLLHCLWGKDAEIVLDAIITGAEPLTNIYPLSADEFTSYDMRLPSDYFLRVHFDKRRSGVMTATIQAGDRRAVAEREH